MFGIFKRKKKEIQIVDNRKIKQEIVPVSGDLDPMHAIMIAAAMQSGEVVFGQYEGDTLTIED